MPLGGFGNLIALPLQRRAREKGASVFVDENLKPYDDQWAFLSTALRESGGGDLSHRQRSRSVRTHSRRPDAC